MISIHAFMISVRYDTCRCQQPQWSEDYDLLEVIYHHGLQGKISNTYLVNKSQLTEAPVVSVFPSIIPSTVHDKTGGRLESTEQPR